MTRKRNKMSEMAKYEAKMQREARYQDNLDLLMNGGDELLPGDRMTLARSCWLNTGRDIERSDDRAEIARLTVLSPPFLDDRRGSPETPRNEKGKE